MPTGAIMREQYSEDFFAETRMSFGEHLEDLRRYLWRAVIGLFVGIVLSFYPLSGWILQSIKGPVEHALAEYHVKYYEDYPEEKWVLLERIKQELADPKNASKLERLATPKAMPVTVSTQSLDQAMRLTYPELFKAGGPLANTAPPAADAAPAPVTLHIKP